MKRFVLSVMIVLCVIFSSMFVGCSGGNPNYQEYTPKEGSKFFDLEQYVDPHLGTVTILVDRDTRIVYMLINLFINNIICILYFLYLIKRRTQK